MGYPLYALALLVVVWAVRRSDQRLKELEDARVTAEAALRLKYRSPRNEA